MQSVSLKIVFLPLKNAVTLATFIKLPYFPKKYYIHTSFVMLDYVLEKIPTMTLVTLLMSKLNMLEHVFPL